MSTLTILIDDKVAHTFVYDELQCTVEHTELMLTATRGPTGYVRDGLIDLPTGTVLDGLMKFSEDLVTPNEARSLWGDK